MHWIWFNPCCAEKPGAHDKNMERFLFGTIQSIAGQRCSPVNIGKTAGRIDMRSSVKPAITHVLIYAVAERALSAGLAHRPTASNMRIMRRMASLKPSRFSLYGGTFMEKGRARRLRSATFPRPRLI